MFESNEKEDCIRGEAGLSILVGDEVLGLDLEFDLISDLGMATNDPCGGP